MKPIVEGTAILGSVGAFIVVALGVLQILGVMRDYNKELIEVHKEVAKIGADLRFVNIQIETLKKDTKILVTAVAKSDEELKGEVFSISNKVDSLPSNLSQYWLNTKPAFVFDPKAKNYPNLEFRIMPNCEKFPEVCKNYEGWSKFDFKEAPEGVPAKPQD